MTRHPENPYRSRLVPRLASADALLSGSMLVMDAADAEPGAAAVSKRNWSAGVGP